MSTFWEVAGKKYKCSCGYWYIQVVHIIPGTSVKTTRWEICDSPF